MSTYEQAVKMQLRKFERSLLKSSGLQRWSKQWQQKFDGLIPQKIHQSLAKAVETGVKSFLQGLNLLQPKQWVHQEVVTEDDDLKARTEEARRVIQAYRRIASLEGAGTGFGGIVASTIDFPALISIKLKMLQELLLIFGHRLESFEERLYLIKLFELRFSGQKARQRLWTEIKQWETQRDNTEWESWESFDWEEFYMEYKQSIELRKLLQILPGVGAVVGAWANYTFLDDLGETAVRCLQLRYLQQKYGEEWFQI
jgi:uncharacterized protein (DUF697 family)